MYSDARQTLETLRDLIRFAVSRFEEAGLCYGHGNHNAWDEAAHLLLRTLHLAPDTDLTPWLDARLTGAEKSAVLTRIEARVTTRKPLAYLLGEAWLGSYRFACDARAIVPRSFIAGLLPDALAPWIPHTELVHRALDLCTGSACLAILLAEHYPDARIDASDCSADALALARCNVVHYAYTERIHLWQGDLFAVQPYCPASPSASSSGEALGSAYDLIVCNPPYVDAAAITALPAEYRHEPALALASGVDGLDLIRRLLAQTAAHLSEHGVLLLEVGHQRPVLEAAFPHLRCDWLETDAGDGFVCLLTRAALVGQVR